MPRVSDVLNRHVSDTQADMVVMGAYGHSRFREAILGGAAFLLCRRPSRMNRHAGQWALPGGRLDPGEGPP